MIQLYFNDYYNYKEVFVYKLNKPLKYRNSYEIQKRYYINLWKYYDKYFHKLQNSESKYILEILNHLWRKKINNDLDYFDTIFVEQFEDCCRYSICFWLENIKQIARFGVIDTHIGNSDYYIEDLKSRGY